MSTQPNDGVLNHPMRVLLQGLVALVCCCLIAYTYYQMLLGDFSLAVFAQRALLTSMTAAVVLLLHRLLFYRLPPAVSLCLWVVVLVQISGVSLASFGLFDRGLENQLPEIAVQTPAQTQVFDTDTNTTPALQAQVQLAEEVTLSYPSGAQQTVSYSQTLAQAVHLVWLVGASSLCLWFWGTYLIFTWRLPKGVQCIPPAVLETFAHAKQTAQTAQDIRLVFTAKDGPLLLGILRPRIVLPVHYCDMQANDAQTTPSEQQVRQNAQSEPNSQQEAIAENTQPLQTEPATEKAQDLYFILLHELTHAKNGDNLWSALAVLTLATQWYNPLVWLCFASLKRDIERRCDYHVADTTRNKKAYATVLLKTIQQKG